MLVFLRICGKEPICRGFVSGMLFTSIVEVLPFSTDKFNNFKGTIRAFLDLSSIILGLVVLYEVESHFIESAKFQEKQKAKIRAPGTGFQN